MRVVDSIAVETGQVVDDHVVNVALGLESSEHLLESWPILHARPGASGLDVFVDDLNTHLKRLAASDRGFLDPARRKAVQPFLDAAGREPADQSDEATLTRLVWGLPGKHRDLDRALFLAACNVDHRPGNRESHVDTLAGEFKNLPTSDRQRTRIIEGIADALVAAYVMPSPTAPLAGARLTGHRTDEIFAFIDVPRAGHTPTRKAEIRTVSPTTDEPLSAWEVEINIHDRPIPTYMHFGSGKLTVHTDPEERSMGVKVAFDPPTLNPQQFVLVADYVNDERLPTTGSSYYGSQSIGRGPRRLGIQVRFDSEPVAAFWVQDHYLRNFPLTPAHHEQLPIVRRESGGFLVETVRTKELNTVVSGVVWFWTDPTEEGWAPRTP